MTIQTYVIRIEGGLEKDLTAMGADITAVYNEAEPIVANALAQFISAFKTTEFPMLINALVSLFSALLAGGLPGAEAAVAVEVPTVIAETEANAATAAKPALETAEATVASDVSAAETPAP